MCGPGHDTADVPTSMRLGDDLAGGERPQCVVPAGAWQTAVSLGQWMLAGCTVAPAFDFADFELAGPDRCPLRPSGTSPAASEHPSPEPRRKNL